VQKLSQWAGKMR